MVGLWQRGRAIATLRRARRNRKTRQRQSWVVASLVCIVRRGVVLRTRGHTFRRRLGGIVIAAPLFALRISGVASRDE